MLVIDDWKTVKGYCEDCDEIVEAWTCEDTDTGYVWLRCPFDNTHEVVEAKKCQTDDCDEYAKGDDHFCEWCLSELKVAAESFKNALPIGMPLDVATQDAIDNEWI